MGYIFFVACSNSETFACMYVHTYVLACVCVYEHTYVYIHIHMRNFEIDFDDYY